LIVAAAREPKAQRRTPTLKVRIAVIEISPPSPGSTDRRE